MEGVSNTLHPKSLISMKSCPFTHTGFKISSKDFSFFTLLPSPPHLISSFGPSLNCFTQIWGRYFFHKLSIWDVEYCYIIVRIKIPILNLLISLHNYQTCMIMAISFSNIFQLIGRIHLIFVRSADMQ